MQSDDEREFLAYLELQELMEYSQDEETDAPESETQPGMMVRSDPDIATAASLCVENRAALAEMYRSIVSADPNWKACLESHPHLLDTVISMEHTVSCSCGRFFEQHPTTIDETEGEGLEKVVRQIQTGVCTCLIHSDPDRSLILAPKAATKTLLHAAAASGYHSSAIVAYLLQRKCDINAMTKLHSYTPLFRAVCSKSVEVVSFLLGHPDLDVNLRSKAELHTPLLEAIYGRHYPIVNLLLACPAIDLNVRNFRQETPVIACARMGELTILGQLLQMGADPDSRDHRNMTALMFSVTYGMKTVTKHLLSHGANLHLRNSMGETPLLMAISSDSLESAHLLLEAGADVNEASEDGYPALMVATYANHTHLARLLLRHGAEVGGANPMGYQALHIAAWNGYLTLLRLLLAAGAAPDVRTHDLNTPLSLAAHGNFTTVVEELVGAGGDVNNADKDLDTPLHYAAFNGNVPCMTRLLEVGADPHALNRLGVTALWNTVYRGHLAATKVLVQRNVALSVASRGIEQHALTEEVVMVFDSPRTPLWVACHKGHVDVAFLLVAAGCDLAGEAWIGRGEFPGRCEENAELKEVLKFYHSVPRPLLGQCRIALRRMAGANVRRFIRRLPLPDKMKNYLMLSELTQ